MDLKDGKGRGACRGSKERCAGVGGRGGAGPDSPLARWVGRRLAGCLVEGSESCSRVGVAME